MNERERLTSLGRHLAALPLPPALGKMLLYGVLFSCLDPVLTVACVMAYRWGHAGHAGHAMRGRSGCATGAAVCRPATVTSLAGGRGLRRVLHIEALGFGAQGEQAATSRQLLPCAVAC